MSMPGKGLTGAASAGRGGGGGSSWGARGPPRGPAEAVVLAPSGVMFLCALLVARSASSASNTGDKGQDVITMLDEHACLPCYLLRTSMPAAMHGFPPAVAAPPAFGGRGTRLGGERLP